MKPLTIRHAHAACLALVIAVSSPGTLAQSEQGEARANVLFLLADDLSYEAVRSMGNREVETPNLDRLARRGTTFTHCYNMGSWSRAVCVASRTMLLTGRSLWRAQRVYQTSADELREGRWWPSYMKAAGYRTYMTGKWHVRASAEESFDVARHVRAGMPKATSDAYNRPLMGHADPWSPYDREQGGFWEGGKHWSEVTADDAVDYISLAKEDETPFFIYVAFNAPHDPRQAPRGFVEKYSAEEVAVPGSFLPEYPFKEEIGCGPGLRDERLGPFPRTEHAVRVHRQEYYAIITHMDAQIGRILDALEASGKGGQTWIFFTSDHGLAVGNHGLFGKQNMYDHSLRVPFFVAGPDVPVNAQVDAPIYLQDVMPTVLELAGVTRPDHVDFHSLLPLLKGHASQSPQLAVYGAYLGLQRAAIQDGWKVIYYPKADIYRLFNLRRDPLELRDLAASERHAAVLKRMKGVLEGLQLRMEDPLLVREAGS